MGPGILLEPGARSGRSAMTLQLLLLAALILAVVPVLASVGGKRRWFVVGVYLLVVAGAGLTWVSVSWPLPLNEFEVTNRPIEVDAFGYVNSDACRSCHPSQHASWDASFHSTMTQPVTPETVAAPFEGEVVQGHRGSYRYWREDGKLWAEIPDPSWQGPGPAPRAKGEVVLSTGSHHLQLYWFNAANGRTVGMTGMIWNIEEQEWLPVPSNFLRPEIEVGHAIDGRYGLWNLGCANCHTTNPRGRRTESGAMDTTMAEFGIACEACHGPGAKHVAANQRPLRRLMARGDEEGDPTIVNPARLDHVRSSEVCGQCHGVFVPREVDPQAWDVNTGGFTYRPGQPLEDSRALVRPALPESLEDPLVKRALEGEPGYLQNRFWADGQIRIAGREHSGLLESPCYQRGELSCLSCHDMHPDEGDERSLDDWVDGQVKPNGRENATCTQCHEEYADTAALEAHSLHEADSAGSNCMNCHMPYTTYGLLKALRSHEIGVPSAQESLEHGRPNACNLCHLDKTLDWTAESLEEWHETERPAMDEIATRVPASMVWSLKGEAAQRALTAWHFGWNPALEASGKGWQGKVLSQLLEDPYPAVRFIARRSLREQPGFEDFDADVMSPGADLAAVAAAARRRWESNRTTDGQAPNLGGLLVDPEGSLPPDLFQQLLAQRDDRFLYLAE